MGTGPRRNPVSRQYLILRTVSWGADAVPTRTGDSARVRDVLMEEARARDAQMEGARVRDVPMEEARVRGVPMEGARARDVPMEEARVRGVPMEEARQDSPVRRCPSGLLQNVRRQ